MPHYLSVEEVASILGTTDRTVRRMLNEKRLSGSQHTEKGKMVWKVHATKELLEKRANNQHTDFIDDVEVRTVSNDEPFDAEPPPAEDLKNNTATIVEEFWNQFGSKFLEKLEAKDQLIGQMQKEIEEKERQLRLLPDLQKQAEQERQTAEIKELEVEALKKQIAALEEEKLIFEETAEKASALEQEVSGLKNTVAELKRPWWKKIF